MQLLDKQVNIVKKKKISNFIIFSDHLLKLIQCKIQQLIPTEYKKRDTLFLCVNMLYTLQIWKNH